MDYDVYAPTYAWARVPLAWVVEPLDSIVRDLPRAGKVLEIGCGTGNYIRALAAAHAGRHTIGFDLSLPMLREARRFASSAEFVRGDAATAYPFADETFSLAFAVDVIHHIDDSRRFFAEAFRVLAPSGRLVLFTDSEDTLRRRSLTEFFPEILPIEAARYPRISRLHAEAEVAGFCLSSQGEATGRIRLDRGFVDALEAKCSSAMRLISSAEHAAGMARVREARAAGKDWFSCYDVLMYKRPERVTN
jgi:SAM-dependent methyltransferase